MEILIDQIKKQIESEQNSEVRAKLRRSLFSVQDQYIKELNDKVINYLNNK